ncbi:DUF6941 family protein [Bradyrhizobium lablabi]|uniref:DUF6941 family protein n=1 Tax=Bradyrhizobium lablabi TaxID=722472 RepID=UPI003D31741F
MKGISAVGIFCEDIRREGPGKDTIIGAMSDTIRVPSFPGALRRLAIYYRIRLSVDGRFTKPIKVDLDVQNDHVVVDNKSPGPIPHDVIERSIANAKKNGVPFATIIARTELAEPVEFPGPTKLVAVLRYGDQKEVCGILNVIERPKDASSASPPPSEQSEPAAPAS